MGDVDDSPSPSSPNPNPNPSDRHSPSPSRNQTLTLTLATQTPAAAGATVGGGGREDCWSEGATTTLIDAWGERYLRLSRGNLKQRHWQEVADAVTARDGRTKAPRTEFQCKNRIDTLKKKYKSEKSRIAASAHSRPSTWRFFRRLDRLLGAAGTAGPPPVPAFPPQFPQRLRTRKRYRSPVSVSSGASDSLPPSPSPPPPPAARASEGVGEVTRAVLRLAEVYERVERTKARQAAETERRWLEFVRELELQRTQFFVRTQMELSQLRRKHPHHRRRQRSGRTSSTDSNGNDNGNHHCSNNNGDGENDGDNME